jgi:hypothetical protein
MKQSAGEEEMVTFLSLRAWAGPEAEDAFTTLTAKFLLLIVF